MTNEQMIRELRAVAEKYKGKHVFTCETNINLMATDAANRIESLCDEINRQKAEIERLQDYNENLRCINTDLSNNLLDEVETAKAEAVKEFAERLKKTIHDSVYRYWNFGEGGYYLAEDVDEDIDILVKEFTEEKT